MVLLIAFIPTINATKTPVFNPCWRLKVLVFSQKIEDFFPLTLLIFLFNVVLQALKPCQERAGRASLAFMILIWNKGETLET